MREVEPTSSPAWLKSDRNENGVFVRRALSEKVLTNSVWKNGRDSMNGLYLHLDPERRIAGKRPRVKFRPSRPRRTPPSGPTSIPPGLTTIVATIAPTAFRVARAKYWRPRPLTSRCCWAYGSRRTVYQLYNARIAPKNHPRSSTVTDRNICVPFGDGAGRVRCWGRSAATTAFSRILCMRRTV